MRACMHVKIFCFLPAGEAKKKKTVWDLLSLVWLCWCVVHVAVWRRVETLVAAWVLVAVFMLSFLSPPLSPLSPPQPCPLHLSEKEFSPAAESVGKSAILWEEGKTRRLSLPFLCGVGSALLLAAKHIKQQSAEATRQNIERQASCFLAPILCGASSPCIHDMMLHICYLVPSVLLCRACSVLLSAFLPPSPFCQASTHACTHARTHARTQARTTARPLVRTTDCPRARSGRGGKRAKCEVATGLHRAHAYA
jgi:hypothetical protein